MPSFVAAFSREQLIAAVRVADFYAGTGGAGGAVAYKTALAGKALVAQDTIGGNPLAADLGQNAIDIQPSRTAVGSPPTPRGARGTDSVVVGNGSGDKSRTPGSVFIGANLRDDSAAPSADANVLIGYNTIRQGKTGDTGSDVIIGNQLAVKNSTGNNVVIGPANSLTFIPAGTGVSASTIVGSSNVIDTGASTTIAVDQAVIFGASNQIVRCANGGVVGLNLIMDGGSSDAVGHVIFGGFSTFNAPNPATGLSVTRFVNGSGGVSAAIDAVSGPAVGDSLIDLGASTYGADGANTRHRFALADGGCQAVTVTSTTAVVVPNNCTTVYVRGTFAGAGTVTLPALPIFGQEVILSVESSTLTGLTVNANTGQSRIGPGVMSFAQGSFSRWRYGGIQAAPDTAWRRVG